MRVTGTLRTALPCALLCFGLTACGSSPRNTTLKNRVSSHHLAPIAGSDRGMELQAHHDVFLAEWQIAFTKGQISGAKLEIKIGKNDLASAKLEVKSAGLESKAADDQGDMNRVSHSDKAAKVALLEVEVKELAIDRAKQSLVYLEKRLAHEEMEHRKIEAELEWERAKSLEAAGIRPPKFDMKTYKAQHTARSNAAKSSKAAVAAEQSSLRLMDAKLLKMETEVARLSGKALPQPAPEATASKAADQALSEPPTSANPVDAKPTVAVKPEVKPAEVKPAEVKPAEVKPAEVKPAEVKPAEVKPPEVKPAEGASR